MTPSAGAAQPRKTLIVSGEIADALRTESRAATPAERIAGVEKLASLYRELHSHDRIAKSKLLQRQRRRILFRLISIFEEVTLTVSPLPTNMGNEDVRSEVTTTADRIQRPEAILMQAAAGNARAAAGAAQTANFDSLEDFDYRQELIDIITGTIFPETWESLGGPSTIVYYDPGLALVVRAPQAVHEKMANLLQNLRAAGP